MNWRFLLLCQLWFHCCCTYPHIITCFQPEMQRDTFFRGAKDGKSQFQVLMDNCLHNSSNIFLFWIFRQPEAKVSGEVFCQKYTYNSEIWWIAYYTVYYQIKCQICLYFSSSYFCVTIYCYYGHIRLIACTWAIYVNKGINHLFNKSFIIPLKWLHL